MWLEWSLHPHQSFGPAPFPHQRGKNCTEGILSQYPLSMLGRDVASLLYIVDNVCTHIHRYSCRRWFVRLCLTNTVGVKFNISFRKSCLNIGDLHFNIANNIATLFGDYIKHVSACQRGHFCYITEELVSHFLLPSSCASSRSVGSRSKCSPPSSSSSSPSSLPSPFSITRSLQRRKKGKREGKINGHI